MSPLKVVNSNISCLLHYSHGRVVGVVDFGSDYGSNPTNYSKVDNADGRTYYASAAGAVD